MKYQWSTLLLVACAMVTAYGQAPQQYPDFRRKHVNTGMTVQHCTGYMTYLRLTERPDVLTCKRINSFITASSSQVNAVCNGAGTPLGDDRYSSNLPFPVVTCRLHSGERHPHCQYRGSQSTRNIELACDPDQTQRNKRWPTHYGGDVVVVG